MPVSQKDIDQAYIDMRKAGNTHEEAIGVLEPFLAEVAGEADVPNVLRTGTPGPTALDVTAMMGLPFAGGTVASGAGARIAASPGIAGRIARVTPKALRAPLTVATEFAQPALELGGIAVGDVAGRAVTGRPQDIKESLTTGTIGAGIGQGFRLLTRGAGSVGNVPRAAIQEAGVPTAGVLPSIQKVTRPAPRTPGQVTAGISAESEVADLARSAVDRLRKKITPERRLKVAYLQQADAQGIRIDPTPIIDDIINELPTMRAEPTTANFATYLDKFADELINEAAKRGGGFTPSELDEFIRTNLAPKAFTAAGDPAMSRAGAVVRKIKHTATELLNNSLPADVRELNKRISERLTMAEDAEALFGAEKTGVVNRLRTLFREGNEENAQALKFLSDETDKSLLRKARTLATRRSFTADIREASQAQGRFAKLVGRPFEYAARAGAPFQAHIGPAAGGVIARKKSKRERERLLTTP